MIIPEGVRVLLNTNSPRLNTLTIVGELTFEDRVRSGGDSSPLKLFANIIEVVATGKVRSFLYQTYCRSCGLAVKTVNTKVEHKWSLLEPSRSTLGVQALWEPKVLISIEERVVQALLRLCSCL